MEKKGNPSALLVGMQTGAAIAENCMDFPQIEIFQMTNTTLHLQELREQQQRLHRASRMKEITKIRAESNNIETKSTIVMIHKSRSWFSEKISKTNKPFSRLINKRRERT